MIVKVYGDPQYPAVSQSIDQVKKLGHAIYDATYYYCDIAIAPMLRDRLTIEQLEEPKHGILVFHPSPLPFGRGANSIKHAFLRRDQVTAATWFWANEKLDAGDICEMEILKIDHFLTPRLYYELHIIPALLRTLERSLNAIEKGYIRRIKQVEEYATFDRKL